nr:hypothetical protein [Tanacetum cinerariifolium]
MIDDLDADEGVALVDETQGRNDQYMFNTITTAGVEVSTAAITSQISMDEITFTKALIDIKTLKPKAKGIVMQVPSETPTPEKERLARQKEEKANIALIEPWDNTQAMMDVDYKLAARLQEEER